MGIGYYLAVCANSGAPFPEASGKIAYLADRAEDFIHIPSHGLPILTDREVPLPWDVEQTAAAARKHRWPGLVLDFQRPEEASQEDFVQRITAALPDRVAVSHWYAVGRSCPVFLPPCPHHVALSDHLGSWQGRELWLDLALDGETITLTPAGAAIGPVSRMRMGPVTHGDGRLHCHYAMEAGKDSVTFTLWRTKEDLSALAQEAESLGVKALVGLWEELV